MGKRLDKIKNMLGKAIFGAPAQEPPAHSMLINSTSASYTLTTTDYQNWVEDAYYKNEVVNGALNLIMNTFCEAPINVVDEEGNILDNHPTQLLLQHINDLDTTKQFFRQMLLQLYLGDSAFIQKVFTRGGKLTELGLLRPDKVEIKADPLEGILGYCYDPNGTANPIVMPASDIIFMRFVDPLNQLKGWSPLKSLARRIDTDNELTDHIKAVIQNRGEPGSIITAPDMLDPDQAAAIAKSFDNRFSGQRKGKTAVLHGGLEYQSFGMNFKDLEASVLFKTQEAKILSTLGVPLAIYNSISGTEASTYENMKTSYRMFWQQTVIPLQTMVLDYLNDDRDLVPENDFKAGTRIEFDRSKVDALQEDLDNSASRLFNAFNVGIVTTNEVRLQMGLEPIEGGDEVKPMLSMVEDEEPVQEPAIDKSFFKVLDEHAEELTETKEIEVLPLIESIEAASMDGMAANIRQLIESGKSPEEATAIAMELAENAKVIEDSTADVLVEEPNEALVEAMQRLDNEEAEKDNRLQAAEQLAMDYKIASSRLALADKALVKAFRMARRNMKKQINDVLELIGEKSSKKVKAFEQSRIDDTLNTLKEQWRVDLEADSFNELGPLYEASAEQASISLSGSFDLDDPTVRDAITQNTFKFADKVADTSRKAVRVEINRAFDEGLSLGDLSKNIRALGDQWNTVRAEAIARTETVRAANQGARIGYRQAGATKLRYSAVLDSVTSEICTSLDGKIVGINEEFLSQSEGFTQSNGKPANLSYTDGAVPEPPAHPNCRSTIIPVID